MGLSVLDAPAYVACQHTGICEFLEVFGIYKPIVWGNKASFAKVTKTENYINILHKNESIFIYEPNFNLPAKPKKSSSLPFNSKKLIILRKIIKVFFYPLFKIHLFLDTVLEYYPPFFKSSNIPCHTLQIIANSIINS